MIIIRIFAGLGNQLFQYAFGRALSIQRGIEVKYDIPFDPFWKKNTRPYELDIFSISIPKASALEKMKQTKGLHTKIGAKIHSLVAQTIHTERTTIHYVHENDLNSLALENIPNNAYLIGFWQNASILTPIRSTLLKELSFPDLPNVAYLESLANQISKTTSVSIHIRRGDYLSNPSFGLCEMPYYLQAIDYVQHQLEECTFFIFSDSLEWAKAQFRDMKVNTVVVDTSKFQDYIDMQLMSLCQHHIIANSSFSWWGAWLNQKPDKMVIAPEPWFDSGASENHVKEILPEEWVKLNKRPS